MTRYRVIGQKRDVITAYKGSIRSQADSENMFASVTRER